jgi:hypothetical protein
MRDQSLSALIESSGIGRCPAVDGREGKVFRILSISAQCPCPLWRPPCILSGEARVAGIARALLR